MKHLLTLTTIIFCCGILFARLFSVPFWFIYGASAVFFIAANTLRNQSLFPDAAMCCLIFLCGAAVYRNSQVLPTCHIAHYYMYKSETPSVIKGIIVSDPAYENGKARFTFATQTVQYNNINRVCRGNILVIFKATARLRYGDELIIRGHLYRPFSKTYRSYLSNQGICFQMQVSNAAEVVVVKRQKGFSLKKFAFSAKHAIESTISQHLSPLCAGVLEAMVLGEKKDIPGSIYQVMVKTGTVHILVVSGFNVGIVCFAFDLLLRLVRIPRVARISMLVPLLLLYCLLTGASNPVVRATIMGIICTTAYVFKREPDIYNSLSIAALIILISNPRQLFDIGFQLSFTSVVSIAYVYPKLKRILRVEVIKIKALKAVLEGLLVSSAAWFGTLGLIAYYFGIFSPITVIANIFIVPLATFITLCGFSLVLVGRIFPLLAPCIAATTELAVAVLLRLNFFLLKAPCASIRL